MAESDIHVQEKRRFDLLPNLADAIMQYDRHEAEVLQGIVDGRGGVADMEKKWDTMQEIVRKRIPHSKVMTFAPIGISSTSRSVSFPLHPSRKPFTYSSNSSILQLTLSRSRFVLRTMTPS